jgi:hypothetical protein
MTTRKQHKPEFKARVALEALKGEQTLVGLMTVKAENEIGYLISYCGKTPLETCLDRLDRSWGQCQSKSA